MDSANQATGRLHADGPGWASTSRFSRDPLAKDPPQQANGQSVKEDKPPQLIYSHISFAKEIEGNIHERQMEFRERIRLVYGPIEDWGQTLDANRRETCAG